MPILKLSYPGAPRGWNAERYINPNFPLLAKWKILVNTDVDEADAWFVLEDLDIESDICAVPPGMTFLGNLETSYEHDWVINNKFVNQFYDQFDETFCVYLHSPLKTTATPPFLPWMIHANHGPSVWNQPSFEFIRDNMPDLNIKENKIAVFCSLQALTAGHRARLQFVRYLKDYFGDKLDWFGNGIKSTPDKLSILKDYRYSIVLENQARHNIITEKICDAYLGLTFPFYWGAPNLDDYFDRRGFEPISIHDFKTSVRIIENALELSKFETNLDYLLANRNAVLDDFNFLHRILNIVDNRFSASQKTKVKQRIYSIQILKRSFGQTAKSWKANLLVNLSQVDEKKGTNLAPLTNEFFIFLHKIFLINRIKNIFAR